MNKKEVNKMKTNLTTLFFNKKHVERFNDFVSKNEDFATYCDYASAGYLLSANAEIAGKVIPYITKDGIKWDNIIDNVDLTTSQEVIVKYAADLYSGYTTLADSPVSLTNLCYCEDSLIKATLIAVLIRLDWGRDHDVFIDGMTKSLGFVKEV